jgi:NADPH-dependent 2,4-dienoyl-CoA reductase/sulfur reductase-like enzyme
MEAARRAAELGHSVTLVERSDLLGGQLRWAAATPPLGHLSRLIAWYERQLDRLGVTIELGTEASTDSADRVIWATGATIEVPAIDGFETLPTWTTETLFEGEPATTGDTDPDRSVAIVGSGQRALAVALHLAAGDRNVTLLHSDRPGGDTSGLARRALLTRCERLGVGLVPGRLSQVTERGVVLDGGRTVDCTGLVLAEPLRPAGSPGPAIGDGRQPRDIAAAIAEGRQAAEEIM